MSVKYINSLWRYNKVPPSWSCAPFRSMAYKLASHLAWQLASRLLSGQVLYPFFFYFFFFFFFRETELAWVPLCYFPCSPAFSFAPDYLRAQKRLLFGEMSSPTFQSSFSICSARWWKLGNKTLRKSKRDARCHAKPSYQPLIEKRTAVKDYHWILWTSIEQFTT